MATTSRVGTLGLAASVFRLGSVVGLVVALDLVTVVSWSDLVVEGLAVVALRAGALGLTTVVS